MDEASGLELDGALAVEREGIPGAGICLVHRIPAGAQRPHSAKCSTERPRTIFPALEVWERPD